MKPISAHPIALEFPDVDAETFQDLKDSMRKRGFDPQHPIVMFEGKILDGRNRYRALVDINSRAKQGEKIEPVFRDFAGSFEDAMAFSIQENLHRRHLTAGQKALIGESLANLPQGKVSVRNSANLQSLQRNPNDLSIEAASRKVHVAPRTVHYARQLRAIDPEAAQRVKDGKESLNGALKKAKAKTPKAPPPPKPDTDAAGVPIHPMSRAALTDGSSMFRSARAALAAAKKMVKELVDSPYGRQLHAQSIETDFKNIERALRFSAPYSTCPMDDPCDDKCAMCHGTQWISEAQYDGMPRELKKGNK